MRGRRWGLLRDERGAQLVEYLLVLGTMALAVVVGGNALSKNADAKAKDHASCVATLACDAQPSGGEGETSLGAAAGASSPSTPPAARTPARPPRPLWRRVVDVGHGFVVDGAVATAIGVGTAILHPIETMKGLAHAVSHPVQTWTAMRESIANAWAENPERVIGAGVFEVATFVGAPVKAARAARLARVEVAEARRLGQVLQQPGAPWMIRLPGPNVLRTIERGERIRDLSSELVRRTQTTGNEHAIVVLNDGRRVLLEGEPETIMIPSDTRRIIVHTHPDGQRFASPMDRQALSTHGARGRGQQHSYIIAVTDDGGQLVRFDALKPITAEDWARIDAMLEGFGDPAVRAP